MLITSQLKKIKIRPSTRSFCQKACFRTIMPFSSVPLIKSMKYHFVNIQIDSKYYHDPLPTKINEVLDLIEHENKLNEKSMLLEHLTDIVYENKTIILSHAQKIRIIKQLQLWKGKRGRNDKIATVAWVIKKLHLQKQLKSVFEQIVERFENDEWYVNLDQSIKALQAFTHLENEQIKNYIYPRIERNLQKTVWEQNMKVYQRVVKSLLQGGRMESKLWDQLEDYILRNLGMEYTLKTITDIFTCYALAKKGSDIFFQQIQKVIYLGHWNSNQIKQKLLPAHEQNGQFYALLVQTYSIVKTNCDIYLMPDLLDYIYDGVTERRTNYQHLSSFSKIILYLPGLFEKEDEEDIINNLLEHKKPTSISYPEIIQFYNTLRFKGIPLPKKLQMHIENLLISDIRRQLIPPTKVLQICQELLENEYISNEEELWQAVDESIVSKFKYLEGEEAKAVLAYSSTMRYLPNRTKEQLALPGNVSNE